MRCIWYGGVRCTEMATHGGGSVCGVNEGVVVMVSILWRSTVQAGAKVG